MSDDAKGATAVAEPAKKAKPGPAKAKPDKGEKKAAGGKKKGGFNVVLLLVPVALIAALVLAFTLPPTHAMIVNGPLKPLLAKFGLAGGPGAGAKALATPDPVSEVKRLNDELAAAKRDGADKDAKIGQLQSQLTDLQSKPSPSPSPAASTGPVAVPEDVKRTALVWAGMDADKAAEVAARLPDAFVKAVLAQMSADDAAEIMSVMPVKTTARLIAPPTEPPQTRKRAAAAR